LRCLNSGKKVNSKNAFEKIANEQNSVKSTYSSDISQKSKENLLLKGESAINLEETLLNEDNQRFSLRKRRKINYNFKTKMFEYDGEDSDYEEKPKKNNKKK
jgi:hypothetical protein